MTMTLDPKPYTQGLGVPVALQGLASQHGMIPIPHHQQSPWVFGRGNLVQPLLHHSQVTSQSPQQALIRAFASHSPSNVA